MKVCFTSDFHGRAALYAQLDALLSAESPDLLILGGDMFVDGDVDDPVGTQVAYVDADFAPRVAAWRKRLPRMTVACILGNHDWLCAADAVLRHQAAGLLTLLDHRQTWTHGGLGFVGYSCTPPTPYWVKDFERLDLPTDAVPEMGGAFWDRAAQRVGSASAVAHFSTHPSITRDLEAAVAPAGPWIFVCHAPPHDTGLDRLPHVPHPVGSRAVRRFLEKRTPICALHGHIHESPDVTGRYHEWIGPALSVNPGQGKDRLHAVTFESASPATTLRHTVCS